MATHCMASLFEYECVSTDQNGSVDVVFIMWFTGGQSDFQVTHTHGDVYGCGCGHTWVSVDPSKI